tara:strand:- start:78 stop:380 length:303 start_codon:yes stop_codon:yes gene_type:complete
MPKNNPPLPMQRPKTEWEKLSSSELAELKKYGITTQKQYDAAAEDIKSGNENVRDQGPRGRNAAKGGVVTKPKMMQGGMANKKLHSYSGGGSVKDYTKKK